MARISQKTQTALRKELQDIRAARGGQTYSSAVLSDCLEEITYDYLLTLAPGQEYTPREIRSDLQDRFIAEVDAINVAKGSGHKWKLENELPWDLVAKMIPLLEPVKSIALGGLDSEGQYDLIGLYQESGYDEGTYATDEETIQSLIWDYNSTLIPAQVTMVEKRMKVLMERVEPCKDMNIVAVNNGLFHYDTDTLTPFTPDIVVLSKCHYDLKAQKHKIYIRQPDGTMWDLESWMNSLSDHPAIVKVLWQIAGACIRPNVPWNISAWFYSEAGRNGKGTFCRMIRTLVGEKNVASIPLANFSKDFMLAKLTRATVILNDENDVGEYLEKVGNLKAVISGDPIQANRKHKDAIDLKFRGFMIQCMNDMPRIKDKSESFFRRQLFVPFEKCFTGHENTDIKEVYLTSRRDVMEYLLWYLLVKMPKYYKIEIPDECALAQRVYKTSNDSVRQFMDEMLPEFKWDLVPWTFVHDLYVEWYKRNFSNGQKAESTESLARHITGLLPDYPDCGWNAVKFGTNVKSQYLMTQSEPLIDEYELKKWVNPRYKTASDRTKACTPVPAKKYKGGLVRISAAANIGSTDDDSEE